MIAWKGLCLCQEISCDIAERAGGDVFTADECEEIDGFVFIMCNIVNEFFVDHIFVSCGEKYGIYVVSVIRIDGVDQAIAI